MKFKDILNNYKKEIGCSQAQLSKACEITPGVISRYKSGERTPKADSETVEKLAGGLYKLAKEKGLSYTKEEIYNKLNDSLKADSSGFSAKLDNLLSQYEIKNSALSGATGLEVSFISRIRNGKRMPGDKYSFILKVCNYIKEIRPEADLDSMIALLRGEQNEVYAPVKPAYENTESGKSQTSGLSVIPTSKNSILLIKNEISSFDLDSYYNLTHFDKIKVPSAGIGFVPEKEFTGQEALKKAELNFLKHAVSSSTADSIYIYAADEKELTDKEFLKKRMYALFLAVKKGIRLNIVYNIGPLGSTEALSLHYPLFATGKVNGYVTENATGDFKTSIMAGNSECLFGFCLSETETQASYKVTGNRANVSRIKDMTISIISKATKITG